MLEDPSSSTAHDRQKLALARREMRVLMSVAKLTASENPYHLESNSHAVVLTCVSGHGCAVLQIRGANRVPQHSAAGGQVHFGHERGRQALVECRC